MSQSVSDSVTLNKIERKLKILADSAKYDASCSSSGSQRSRQDGGMGNSEGMGICHSYTPDGRCVSLLKILFTNHCIYDCKYCVNRVSSDVPRAAFSVEEIVELTLDFYRRNYIEGLFLSSGIFKSSDETMEKLVEVARSLRQDHKFNGYIHLKIVAGASEDLVEKAGLWADRVSANIEMPTQQDLNQLAPGKTHEEITDSMSTVLHKKQEYDSTLKRMKSTPSFIPAGQTTQMVVGATASPDQSILNSAEQLYNVYSLRRVYYTAYSPIPHADALLPLHRPTLVRENRLYQADWLLRFYGFKANELVTPEKPNLELEVDPKTSWALSNRQYFPVDVNRASKEELLRVPGFGMKTVQAILQTRRFRNLTLDDLGKMKATLKRARYFIITKDSNPFLNQLDAIHLGQFVKTNQLQLSLFEQVVEAKTGEL